MQSVRVMRISGMCEMLWLVAVTPIDRFVMLQQRSREAGREMLNLSRVCREKGDGERLQSSTFAVVYISQGSVAHLGFFGSIRLPVPLLHVQ